MRDTDEPLKDRFAGAQGPSEPPNEEGQGIVTRQDIEALKASLARPQTRLDLEPDGTAVTQLRADLEELKRTRLAAMETRLARVRGRARDDLNLHQMTQDERERER